MFPDVINAVEIGAMELLYKPTSSRCILLIVGIILSEIRRAYFEMGVRAETWTTRVVLEGVRMCDKETVELFALAVEDGMTTQNAGEFAGVSYRRAPLGRSRAFPQLRRSIA